MAQLHSSRATDPPLGCQPSDPEEAGGTSPLGGLLDYGDLAYGSLNDFFDPQMLARIAATARFNRSWVAEYSSRWPCVLMLARRARAFLVRTLVEAHASCPAWPEREAAAGAYVDHFAAVLAGPRSALLTRESAARALAAAAETAAGPAAGAKTFASGWGWKELLRFLFPVITSYGRHWPEASFALQACARATQCEELLALFEPDPCAALGRIAGAPPATRAVAAVLPAILGACARGWGGGALAGAEILAVMEPAASQLVGRLVAAAGDRRAITAALAFAALAGQIQSPRPASPARLLAAVVLRPGLSTKSEPLGVLRYFGCEERVRMAPHFEQHFECRGHHPPRTVRDEILQMLQLVEADAIAGAFGGAGAAPAAVPAAAPAAAPAAGPAAASAAVPAAAPAAVSAAGADTATVSAADPAAVSAAGAAPTAAAPARTLTRADAAAALAPEEPPGLHPELLAGDAAPPAPRALAAHDLAAILNEVARSSSVDPGDLFRSFLGQEGSVLDPDDSGDSDAEDPPHPAPDEDAA